MPHPEIEPFGTGLLSLDDGSQLYWETSGSPLGVPVIWLHGGPGSGLPESWLVVLDDEGHGGAGMTRELERAYERVLGLV